MHDAGSAVIYHHLMSGSVKQCVAVLPSELYAGYSCLCFVLVAGTTCWLAVFLGKGRPQEVNNQQKGETAVSLRRACLMRAKSFVLPAQLTCHLIGS
jgi:hypothetical protein